MTELILNFIEFLKNQLLFNLFGELSLGIDLVRNIDIYLSSFLDFLEKVNFLIPLPDMFICLSVTIFLRVAKFVLFVANWIIRRIFDVIP